MIQNHKKWSVLVKKVWILSCSNLNPLWGRLEAYLEAVSIIHDFPSYLAWLKIFGLVSTLDRVSKKLKISEWNAVFSIYSRDKSKNILSKKFFKLFKNGRVLDSNVYVVKTRIFSPACKVKQQTSIYFLYINIF